MKRHLYPSDWEQISIDIRYVRAGNRCEWCGAENHLPHPVTGSRVVLTVAHLGVDLPDGSPGDKRNKMDCRPENLAALCQRCHLRYDIDEHVENSRVTRSLKRHQAASEAGQLRLWGDD